VVRKEAPGRGGQVGEAGKEETDKGEGKEAYAEGELGEAGDFERCEGNYCFVEV